MDILRHRADRWTVAYTAMVLAVQLALFFLVGDRWLQVLLVVLIQPVQAVAIACNHYQHHRPVFRRRLPNRLYELVLFWQTGMPPYLITLHHNLGHHRHYLDPEHDTLRWQRGDGAMRSLGECLWHNTLGHLTWTVRIGRRFPRIYRRLKWMTLAGCLPLAALAWIDPAATLIVFLLPMTAALANVARLGYQQHAGLDLGEHLTASRNVESRLYNLLTFNSGYHTAHHLRPGVHWSDLPALHREIRAGIPQELRHHPGMPRAGSPGAARGSAATPPPAGRTS